MIAGVCGTLTLACDAGYGNRSMLARKQRWRRRTPAANRGWCRHPSGNGRTTSTSATLSGKLRRKPISRQRSSVASAGCPCTRRLDQHRGCWRYKPLQNEKFASSLKPSLSMSAVHRYSIDYNSVRCFTRQSCRTRAIWNRRRVRPTLRGTLYRAWHRQVYYRWESLVQSAPAKSTTNCC
jgi:hypothetical protein